MDLLPALWYWLCALVAQMCAAGCLAMLACAPLTCLLCILLPYPAHASGSLLILQLVSDWLAARHVVLFMCPLLFHVCCRLAMLACDTLACLLCFLSPYPTHASRSRLILQVVSDWLAARHVVLVVSPLLFLVCWLAGYAGMCPSDLPALLSFAQHHTCIWIPLDSAGGK
jgi:hypothetical protein